MEDDIKEISKWNYGNYSNSNYGSSMAIKIGKLTLYYSYNTVVAFKDAGIKEGKRFFACKNTFSKTTGKHLNWLEPDKDRRLSRKEFREKLNESLNKYNLTTKSRKVAI